MPEPPRDQWAEWLLNRRHGGDPDKFETILETLRPIRDRVLENGNIAGGDVVLDVGAGDGLIALGAAGLVGKSGQVIFSDISEYLLDFCRSLARKRGVFDRCRFIRASADDLSPFEDASVDVVTVRSVLIYVSAKERAFQEFHRVLKAGGRLSIFEPINRFRPSESAHMFSGYDVTPVQDIARKLRALFEQFQPRATDPMLDFDERDLLNLAEQAGFEEIHLEYKASIRPRPKSLRLDESMKIAPNPRIPTLEEAMKQVLTPEEAKRFIDHVRPLVETGQGTVREATVFLRAIKHQ